MISRHGGTSLPKSQSSNTINEGVRHRRTISSGTDLALATLSPHRFIISFDTVISMANQTCQCILNIRESRETHFLTLAGGMMFTRTTLKLGYLRLSVQYFLRRLTDACPMDWLHLSICGVFILTSLLLLASKSINGLDPISAALNAKC
jgi:hypothetical protein